MVGAAGADRAVEPVLPSTSFLTLWFNNWFAVNVAGPPVDGGNIVGRGHPHVMPTIIRYWKTVARSTTISIRSILIGN
jgi:hypothetical protein